MNFDTYFLLSSYAFVATGFLALAFTGRLDPVTMVLYVVALVVSWRVERGDRGRLITLSTARKLSMAYMPLFLLDTLFISGSPFFALSRFILYMSAVKLFQEKNNSDWVWLYSIAFFEMLLASALTIDAMFLVALGLFLFFFVTTLAAFEIRRAHEAVERVEEETHAIRKDRPAPLRRVAHLGSVASSQLAIIVVLTIPIFFLIPRFSGGALGSRFSQTQTLSGFSDEISFGDVTDIKQSSALVMTVQLGADPGRWIRWRGIALDTYENQKWKATTRRASSGTVVLPQTEVQPNIYVLGQGPFNRARALRQDILLEPLDQRNIFAADRVVALEGKMLRLLIQLDNGRGLRTNEYTGSRLAYTAYSDLDAPTPQQLGADTSTAYPTNIVPSNLQLPPLDPRVADLARRVVGDAATPYEKAQRIEMFLKNEFAYSLNSARSDTSIDPVADFLLNTKIGHCEFFASGMTIMLRSLGVPARIVNGFQMGEYNPMSGAYMVRQADAHSWVEVYFAGPGRWVEFDPTPSAGINQYGPPGLAGQFRQMLEATRMLWIRYVVALDDQQQMSILRSTQAKLVAMKDWIVSSFKTWRASAAERLASVARAKVVTRHRIVVGIVVLLLVGTAALGLFMLHGQGWVFAGIALPMWRLRGFWWRRGRNPERTAVLFYEQMALLLSRYGLRREPHETPREFARRSGLEEVDRITEFYHRVRYGGGVEGGDRDVAEALARLSARLKREGIEKKV